MMQLVAELQCFKTDRLQGVVLPYAGGKFDAIAVEARAGSLASVIGRLTPASLFALAASTHLDQVALAMPRFSISSEASIDGSLKALGLSSAFTSSADFSGIVLCGFVGPGPLSVDDAALQLLGTELDGLTAVDRDRRR